MKDFSSIKIDTSMTLEELLQARYDIHRLLFNLEYEIKLKQMSKRNSLTSFPTKIYWDSFIFIAYTLFL